MLDRDVLLQKIQETVDLGGDQILMQGGLHPDFKIEWYEELLHDIKRHFPQVNVHGFSPPEIHHFTKVSKLPLRTVLERLKATRAWAACPAAAARFSSIACARAITRGKVMTDDWLNVYRVWHELGGRSTATMMFGHIETLAERIEHSGAVAPIAGRDGRIYRLYLLDLSARSYRHGRHSRRPARSSI